jgi:hypothetical protein
MRSIVLVAAAAAALSLASEPAGAIVPSGAGMRAATGQIDVTEPVVLVCRRVCRDGYCRRRCWDRPDYGYRSYDYDPPPRVYYDRPYYDRPYYGPGPGIGIYGPGFGIGVGPGW